ncbi:Hypothetical protein FKW44_000309 [Caligus rogercresseyi]|uniref:Uncharacterized protein n=1 Tax=Caligus rogercresseyi TaxID=217165 RepID=A0A7T8QUS9_CALRO|nr:Hypothetical protein FKW44_000309 [Caligus rogercresseyi]
MCVIAVDAICSGEWIEVSYELRIREGGFFLERVTTRFSSKVLRLRREEQGLKDYRLRHVGFSRMPNNSLNII